VKVLFFVATGALSDLNKAIEVSQGQGKVACQAYTQRGLIKRLESRKLLLPSDSIVI